MTLPVPSEMTADVGDLLAAANWNSNVRDAINYLLNRPMFVGYQNTAQSIATATYTGVTYDTTVIDTYSGHSNTTNPSRYTAQVAGWYRITGTCAFVANTSGSRATAMWVNGVQINYTQQEFGPVAGNFMAAATGVIFLNVGDYVEIRGYQSSGGALNTIAGYSGIAIEWVHA